MPELLLELGSEELPASFVRKAYTDLEAAILKRLDDAAIGHGSSQSLGTPRRLIVAIQDVQERQPDTAKESRGPALTAAYDAEGNPTKALLGFCKGQGIEPGEVRKDGEYVWATKHIPGRSTPEVLSELLPEAIRSLAFEKSMRWGASRMRFARPIRWIVAAFGGAVVPFAIEDIDSGLESRGHRFNFPEPFPATSFQQLMAELRQRQVEPDPAVREQAIRDQAVKVAKGTPALTDALVDENVFLTEWPSALQGAFHEAFLELPPPVLVTAMAKHEKFFPVRDEAGKLTNRFVSIRNGGVEETVREGNEWVLNARFNDANFFFEEDKKHTLEHFLEKTIGIVFQDKLGTVRQRAHRLSELVGDVARATGANEQEIASATHAGLFAKADLSSGLVSELPALQGMIGAEYARRENFPDPVCWAIASHYDLSKNATVDCEGARTAVRLLMADQLDKLAGYLGIGLVPTGSSDPYGLRRAATMLIEAAIRWPTRFHGYAGLCHCARLAYGRQGFIDVQDCSAAFAEIMQSRYSNIFEGARHDLLEAAIGATPEHILDPQGVQFRLKVLQAVADDTQFIFTATRPLNIVDAAAKKGIEFETDEPLEKISNDSLESAEGAAVANLLRNTQDPARRAAHNRDVDILLAQLRQLQEPINTFFDTTMVMDENPSVRYARLSLMNAAAHQFRLAGEFSKIVIAGE